MKAELALEEAKRCLDCENAPCSKACPSGRDIPNFIEKIKESDLNGALEILMENNPLPGICGRVCPSPCQANCVRGKTDEPIRIPDLERYVADQGEVEIKPATTDDRRNIAIVGSGPAGLTAGYFLARDGHRVSIYEKFPKPGGMLRYGIPDFRLSKDVLDKEIGRIEDTGLKIKLSEYVEDIDNLFDRGYDAVFIGIGAPKPSWMDIPGEELEGVIHAISFLKKANLGEKIKLGKKVAVVGCGDVALDAARFANRLGSEAFIVYRRSREQMPASEEEFEECNEEGVKFNFLTNPKRFIGDNGKVTSMECLRMELGEPDSSGRKRPIPIEGTEFTIEVDNVIEAISQQPDTNWLKRNNLEINKWNCIEVNEDKYNTSRDAVFAAGDVVTGPKTISWAIGTAKKAIKSIRKFWLC